MLSERTKWIPADWTKKNCLLMANEAICDPSSRSSPQLLQFQPFLVPCYNKEPNNHANIVWKFTSVGQIGSITSEKDYVIESREVDKCCFRI